MCLIINIVQTPHLPYSQVISHWSRPLQKLTKLISPPAAIFDHVTYERRAFNGHLLLRNFNILILTVMKRTNRFMPITTSAIVFSPKYEGIFSIGINTSNKWYQTPVFFYDLVSCKKGVKKHALLAIGKHMSQKLKQNYI